MRKLGPGSRRAVRHVSLTSSLITAVNDAEDRRSNARVRSRVIPVASANQPARSMIGTRKFSSLGGETPWLISSCERRC